MRRLPDGSGAYVSPFHISMKGHEKLILFRDEEDYDAMVKILCVCAKRKNVIVIIYAVVSNHCHMAVLSKTQEDARKYGLEVKRMYSMWFSGKYGLSGVMVNVDIKAIALDKTTKEGKVLAAMADILEDMALTVADSCDQIDAIDEDLESLEEYVYEDLDFDDDYDDMFDDDEEGEYEFECPNCHEVVFIDESVFDEGKEIECPNCGAKLEGFYEEEDED